MDWAIPAEFFEVLAYAAGEFYMLLKHRLLTLVARDETLTVAIETPVHADGRLCLRLEKELFLAIANALIALNDSTVYVKVVGEGLFVDTAAGLRMIALGALCSEPQLPERPPRLYDVDMDRAAKLARKHHKKQMSLKIDWRRIAFAAGGQEEAYDVIHEEAPRTMQFNAWDLLRAYAVSKIAPPRIGFNDEQIVLYATDGYSRATAWIDCFPA